MRLVLCPFINAGLNETTLKKRILYANYVVIRVGGKTGYMRLCSLYKDPNTLCGLGKYMCICVYLLSAYPHETALKSFRFGKYKRMRISETHKAHIRIIGNRMAKSSLQRSIFELQCCGLLMTVHNV